MFVLRCTLLTSFVPFASFSARGDDLCARIDGDSLPEFEAVKILKQVLEGVKFMHDNGFMHLDLKVSYFQGRCSFLLAMAWHKKE